MKSSPEVSPFHMKLKFRISLTGSLAMLRNTIFSSTSIEWPGLLLQNKFLNFRRLISHSRFKRIFFLFRINVVDHPNTLPLPWQGKKLYPTLLQLLRTFDMDCTKISLRKHSNSYLTFVFIEENRLLKNRCSTDSSQCISLNTFLLLQLHLIKHRHFSFKFVVLFCLGNFIIMISGKY